MAREEGIAIFQISAVGKMETAARQSLSRASFYPAELLPTQEQLGDMYLELGRHAEALSAYEAVLDREPNRLNSLCGGARAAELGGEPDKARSHYQTLNRVADPASSRDCVRSARTFLNNR